MGNACRLDVPLLQMNEGLDVTFSVTGGGAGVISFSLILSMKGLLMIEELTTGNVLVSGGPLPLGKLELPVPVTTICGATIPWNSRFINEVVVPQYWKSNTTCCHVSGETVVTVTCTGAV